MNDANGTRSRGWLLFAWSPTGYSLREREGDPPAVGSTVTDGETTLVVTKLGPSPRPGDARPCAYTMGPS